MAETPPGYAVGVVHADLPCGDCGAPMRLRDSQHGLFWGCTRYPACDGAHGAHPDGRPLGRPASKALKRLRILAHSYFDRIWLADVEAGASKRRARGSAYAWMRRELDLTAEQAHVGEMNETTCWRLIEATCRRLDLPLPARPATPSEASRRLAEEVGF